MKSRLAAAAALTIACASMTACKPNSNAEPAEPPAPAATPAAATPAAPAPADAPAPTPAAAAQPAAPGAPAYAAIYPGGALDRPAVVASGPDGDGGAVTFTTTASPDAVVEFYKDRAEQSGLTSVMGMNQGDARAYGAAAQAEGGSLQVVASPGEEGETSVQLTWSEGQ